jgi:hypothetical protein
MGVAGSSAPEAVTLATVGVSLVPRTVTVTLRGVPSAVVTVKVSVRESPSFRAWTLPAVLLRT